MKWFELSEDVLIVSGIRDFPSLDDLKTSGILEVVDVVQTENEIAVQHTSSDVKQLISAIERISENSKNDEFDSLVEVPICYDLGLDWEEVESIAGLSRREIAELHASTLYQSRYGFLPGFIYLGGLDEKLHCPRKESPRKSIPSGAVGIGGTRTGIYSLESPGGWQIIGRTPLELFNAESDQPFIVPNGATIRFFPISKKEFDDWR